MGGVAVAVVPLAIAGYRRPGHPSRAGWLLVLAVSGLVVLQSVATVSVTRLTSRTPPPHAVAGPSPAATSTPLQIESAGPGRVAIQFPAGTSREIVQETVLRLELTLVDGDPTTGRYLFELPKVEVADQVGNQALLRFPAYATRTDIESYLESNSLRLIRFARDREGERLVWVELPPPTISYVPLAASRRLPAQFRAVPYPPVRPATASRPAPPASAAAPPQTRLYVRLIPGSKSTPAAVGSRAGITFAPPSSGSHALVASVDSQRAEAILQLLSDLPEVECAADTATACKQLAAAVDDNTALKPSSAAATAYTAPTGLTVAAEAAGSRLRWDPARGASSYLVQRAAGGTSVTLARITPFGDGRLTYLDRTAPAGAASYRVLALHDCPGSAAAAGCDVLAPPAESPYATPRMSVTRAAAAVTAAAAPAFAASGLTGVASDGHVQLRWAPTVGAARYRAYRAAGQGPAFLVATTSSTELIDVEGSSNVTYTYRVVPLSAEGVEGTPSATASVTWRPATSAPVFLKSLPPESVRLSGTIRFQVDARTGDGRGSVVWRLSGPRAAVTIGSAAGIRSPNDPLAWSASRNWDSTAVPDGTYSLRVTIVDGAGNPSELTQRFRVQNAPPSAPSQAAASPAVRGVLVNWDQPLTSGGAFYEIFRDRTPASAPLAELPVNQRFFLDVEIIGRHLYEVRLVDGAQHVSRAVSVEGTGPAGRRPAIISVVDLEVLVPNGEALINGGRAGGRLLLVAQASPAVDTLVFQFSRDGRSWQLVPASVCTATCRHEWQLSELEPGGYQVRAAGTAAGRVLTSSPINFVVGRSAVLPAALEPVAQVTPDGVLLTWMVPVGLTPTGYAVFRHDPREGWQLLDDVAGPSYLDRTAPAGVRLRYRVHALDREGNLGAPSAEVDGFVPAVRRAEALAAIMLPAPQRLRAIANAGRVALAWDPVVGAEAYLVERARRADGPFSLMAWTANPLYVDVVGALGGVAFYRVRAIAGSTPGDPSVKVGALRIPAPLVTSTVGTGRPAIETSLNAPSAPPTLRAAAASRQVELSWTGPVAAAAGVTYSVYRLDPDAFGFRLAASGLPATVFTDRFLVPGATYGYVVTATDASGRESGYSPPAWAMVPIASRNHAALEFLRPSAAEAVFLSATEIALRARATSGAGQPTFAFAPEGGSWIGIPGVVPLTPGAGDASSLAAAGSVVWAVTWNTDSLIPGSYRLRVSVTDMQGNTHEQVQTVRIDRETARGPPATLEITSASATPGGLLLQWKGVPGATFQVRRNVPGSGSFDPIAITTTTQYHDRNLIPGLTYRYQVVQTSPALAISPVIVGRPLPGFEADGRAASADGAVHVEVPAAVRDRVVLTAEPDDAAPALPAGLTRLGRAYSVDAFSLATAGRVHRLDHDAVLDFALPGGISEIQATALGVYHWDELMQSWSPVASTVDPGRTRIRARVTHFSLFTVGTSMAGVPSGAAAQMPVVPGEVRKGPLSRPADLNVGPATTFDVAPTGEILSLRTANSKTFRNPDGRFSKRITAGPQHFKDSTGTWQEINTTLVPVGPTSTSVRNTAGATQVQLPGDLSVAPVQFATPAGITTFTLEGSAASVRTVSGSQATYAGVLSGVDAVYAVIPEGLKESLVIKSTPAVAPSFTFDLNTAALSLQQVAGGAIRAVDATGAVQFTISAPWMHDALTPQSELGTISTKVAVTLTGGSGLYRLTYTPDAAWLSDPARHYPVTLDPSLTSNATSGGEVDVQINSCAPNFNYSASVYNYLPIGYTPFTMPDGSTCYAPSRAMMLFGGTMGDGLWATSATLSLYQYTNYMGGGKVITASAAAGGWSASIVTWNNQPGVTDAYGAAQAATLNGVGWVPWDVTTLVRSWEKHSLGYNGFVLRGVETGFCCNEEFFYSGIFATAGVRPQLTINYDTYYYNIASASLSSTWVPSGGTTRAQVVLQNLGTATWDDSVRLSYRWIQNGVAITNFDPRVHIPGVMTQNDLGVLNFDLQAPPAYTGNLQLQFAMVRETLFWFQWLVWTPGSYSDMRLFNNGAVVPIAAESAVITGRNLPSTLLAQPGSLVPIPVTVRNNTNLYGYTWSASNHADIVRLGVRDFRKLTGDRVGGLNGRTYLPQDVPPNSVANVDTVVQAPGEPGDYVVRLDLARDATIRNTTTVGAVTPGQPGALANPVDAAMQFNGSSGYLQLPAAAFGGWPNVTALGVELWFKTTQPGVLLGQTDGTPPGGVPAGYVPALYIDTAGAIRASVFWHGSATNQLVAGGSYLDGRWHHVVDTYAGGTETLYVDGTAKGSQAVSQTGYGATSYTYFLGTGYVINWLGVPAGAGWWYFPGSIDQVATYSGALAASRVQAHYSAASAADSATSYRQNVLADGPIAYYPLQDGSGTITADATGSGKSGTIASGVTPGVSGALSVPTGGAVQFDGLTGYIPVPVAAFNGWPNTTTTSVELWFKTTQPGVLLGQTGGGTLPGAGTPNGYVPALYVDTTGAVRAEVFWHGTVPLSSGGSYLDGKWHHVVDTFNVGGTETLYVDGVAKVSASGLAQSNYASTYGYFLGTGYVSTWSNTPAGATWWYFPGAIAEFATYPWTLIATRVQAHYNAASAPNSGAAYRQTVLSDGPITYFKLDEASGRIVNDASAPTWFEDRGNQPLEVRLRVLAAGEDKAAHVPVSQNDGTALAINTSNGFSTLQATDFEIPERGAAQLHVRRTYNGVNASLADNGTGASNTTYGIGWTFDFQRNVRLGLFGPSTLGSRAGLLTDAQGKSWPLTWNPGRSLWEDPAGNRTLRPSTASVDSAAGSLTVPGVAPVDLIARSTTALVNATGSPRGRALQLGGSPPTALVFPDGSIPAQQNGTIEFWFSSPVALGTGNTTPQVFFSDHLGRFSLGYTAAGTIAFSTTDADTGTTDVLQSAVVSWAANTWHHIAVTWQENGAKQLVLDTALPVVRTTHGQSPVGEVFFGYNPDGTPSAANGSIAELRVEGRALDATTLANDGVPGTALFGDTYTLYMGTFNPLNGVNSAAGTYILRNPDQSEEEYAPWGQLIRERDRFGNSIRYDWDAPSGRLLQIVDEALPTRKITLTYPAVGQALATDHANRSVTYQLSPGGDLISVIRSNQVPDPMTGVVSSQPATTSYAYLAGHALQRITDPRSANTTLTYQQSYRQTVLNDSPLGYWRLDEPSGTTAFDSSGNGNSGAIGGGVRLNAGGGLASSSDPAMAFDGSTGAVTLNLPALDTVPGHSVTVEFWMYWLGPTTGSQMPFGFNGYDLFLYNGQFGFNTAVGDLYGMPSASLLNTWAHVAAVFYNGDAKLSQLYVNGVQQSLSQLTGLTGSKSVTPAARISGWSFDASYKLNGSLDEVAVYNGALPASRILAHYNAGRTVMVTSDSYRQAVLGDAPVSYYRLNEPAGTTAYNALGTGNNGAISGGVQFAAGGGLSNSTDPGFRFDGATGYVEVPYSPSSNPASFSIEVWAYLTGGNGTWRTLIASRNVSSTSPVTSTGYDLYAAPNEIWQFWVRNGSTWVAANGPAVVYNQWTHLVGTYTANSVSLYVNGILVGQAAGGLTPNSTQPLRIGSGQTEGAPNFFFPGVLDEVSIYPSALSASWVLAHYNAAADLGTGQVSSVQDARGNTVATLLYNDRQAVTQVTDARSLNSFYTFQQFGGRTLSVTDTGNNVTRYDWDGGAAFRLQGVTSPAGIRQNRLLNAGAPVGQQEQLLLADTSAQPARVQSDYMNGSLPAGGTVVMSNESWIWDANVTLQPGKSTHRSTPAVGMHQHYFTVASGIAIPAGAIATQWVFLEPGKDPPGEIMLQWLAADPSGWHRAYWGLNLLSGWTTANVPSSMQFQAPVPPPGRWVPLTIPFGPSEWGRADVDMAGRTLTGVAFTAFGGAGAIWWGPLTFDFPAPSVPDPIRTISRYTYNDRNDVIAAVDPNGIAAISDVDPLGVIRQQAAGVEPTALPVLFQDSLTYPAGMAKWIFEYGYAGTSAAPNTLQQHNGSGSLAQQHSGSTSLSDLYRDVTGLAPGTDIRVSVWVYTSGNSGSGGASLFVEDNLAQPRDGVPSLAERRTASVQTGSAAWTQLTLPFVVDTSGQIRIHLVHSNFAGSTIWADLRVEDLTPAPAVTLQHPTSLYTADFEQALSKTNWQFWANTPLATSAFVTNPALAHSGSGALRLSNNGASTGWARWLQWFTAQAGAKYRATAWLRTVASGSVSGASGGALIWVHDANPPYQVNVSASARTEGRWQMLQIDVTALAAGVLYLELASNAFQGDAYFDDVSIEQVDGGGAWSAGWRNSTSGTAAATWTLMPSAGIGNGPARRVSITATSAVGDVADALTTASVHNGISYVISVWAGTNVPGTTVDFSLRDGAGNVLPMDLPTTCKLSATPTICQNSLTYSAADGPGQLTLLYGGQGARDVFVSHPLIAQSSTLRDYTSAGQATRAYDVFGHETRTDYDSNSLYPAGIRQRVAGNYRDVVMADAPSAYWRFDETAGTVAGDSVGTDNGSIGGSVTLAQPGALWGDNDQAFSFDGVSGSVTVPDAPALASAQTTIEAWIKVDSWITSASIYNRRTAANVGGVTLELGGLNNINFFANIAGTWYLASSGGVTVGVWHHVAGTYDGQSVRVFVDGATAGSTPVAGAINNPLSPLIQIGRNIVNGQAFNGSIDEVAIYPAALSGGRVLAHYQAGRAGASYAASVLPDTPGGYWRLGESAGAAAGDSSGSGNTGTITGGVTLGRAGAIPGDANTAMAFDGSTGYVSVSDTPTLSPTASVSVEAWLYVTALPAGVYQWIVGKGSPSVSYWLRIDAPVEGSKIGFFVNIGGVFEPRVSTTAPPPLNQWTHIVATYDGSNLRMYQNGQLVSTAARAGPIQAAAGPLTIGSGFSGSLDEVAVYSVALPAARVQAHYRAAQARAPTLTTLLETNSLGQLVSTTQADVSTGQRITDRRELDSWGRATAEIRNFNPAALADPQTNVRTGHKYDVNGNETDRYQWGTSGATATPLTLYPSSTVDSSIAGRILTAVAPAPETTTDTVIGTATGWTVLDGYTWNVPTLEGQQIVAGNWTATTKLTSTSEAAGALVGDVHVTTWIWSSGINVWRLISDSVLMGQGLDTTIKTFTLPATAGPMVNFGAGDRFYVQVVLNVTTNTTGSAATKVSVFLNSAAEWITTPGYRPIPWLVTHWDYDLNGNRIRQVLNQVAGQPETASQNVTTTYTFSALNQLTDEQRPAFSVGGSTVRHLVYDNARRPIQVTENFVVGGPQDAQTNVTTTFAYDADGRVTATTNPLGVQGTRSYDALGRLITEVIAASAPAGITAAPAQTDLTLDVGGRVTDILGPGTGSPAVRIRTHVDYDALGRRIAVTGNAGGTAAPANVQTRAVYDPRGATTIISAPTQQQAGGVPTRTELDLAGRKIRVLRNSVAVSPAADVKVTTTTAYDNFGRPTDATDPRGVVTHADYDGLGRPSAVTLDAGSAPHLNLATFYGYSLAGDQVSIVRPRDGGPRTDSVEFDALHRPTASVLNFVAGAAADGQTNVRTETTYDAQSRVLTVKDPLGRISRTDYDLLGRRVALTSNCVDAPGNPCGGPVTSDQNVRTRWQVDAAGRVTAELSSRTGGTDAINLTTAYAYDAQGRLVQVVEDQGSAAAGHLNWTTSYGYDPSGNRLTTTDGRGNPTTITVDPLGRPVKLQDASGYFTQTQYSPAGEGTAAINARNQTNAATLDRLGRVLSQGYLKADGVTAGNLTYAYDAAGNLTSFQSTDTPLTTVAYDPLGRLQSVSGPSSASYSYFKDGTISSIADATGTTSFTEDQLGRIRTAQDPLSGVTTSTAYTFDAGSRLTQRTEANGLVSAFSYSGLDQLNQKTITVPGTLSPFASWTNTYDPAGNRLTETVTLPPDPIAGPATFTYDTVQQLASAAFPTQALASYGYDAAHNRNAVSGTSFGFLANNAISTEGAAGPGQIAYSPDADGNQTKDAAGRVFKFDSLNRLEQVTDGAGTVLASYVYDARGRLAKRTAGAAGTQLVYRGLEDQVVQEQDGTGAVLRSYAWDTRGRRLLVQVPGVPPLLYAVLNNPHGDLVGLVDGTGAVAGTVHYNAWGQILSQTGTLLPFGFQGGFTDPLTGWVRMGVRWYDPRLGRFTSSDPLAPATDLMRPLASHRWQYAFNNPTHYLDPQGLLVIADGGGGDYSPSPPPPPPSSGCRGDCWWLDPPSTYVPPPPSVVHRPSAARSFLNWVGQKKAQAANFVRNTVAPTAVKVAQAYLQVRADIDEGVLLWGKDTVTGLGTLAQVAWERKVQIAAFALAHSPLRAAIDPVGYQRSLQSDARAVVSFASNPENLKGIGQAIIKPYVEDIQSGHPGRAVGRLLPDILLTIGTGGGFAAARGGLKGAEIGGRIARVETAAVRAPVYDQLPLFVDTPYGLATQSLKPEALAARDEVLRGARVFKGGNANSLPAEKSQFFALEHPSTPGYEGRYGVPKENLPFEWVASGRIRPGTDFVTRVAPVVGDTTGGGIEVVTWPGGLLVE